MSSCQMTLEDRVVDALDRHPHLSRRRVRVTTEHGRVVLRGRVSSFFEKQLAQEAVRRLDGIQEISNEIEVAWRRPKA